MYTGRGPLEGTGRESARRSGAGTCTAGRRAREAGERGDASGCPASRELPRPRRGVSEHMAESGAVDAGVTRFGVAGPDTEGGGHTSTAHAPWLGDTCSGADLYEAPWTAVG